MKKYINNVVRQIMARGLSHYMNIYIVNEYPKSGGTWLGQMIGSVLCLPFPRNKIPSPRPSIIHGHYLKTFGIKKSVIIWRDGRDVIVSWYYHCCFINEIGGNKKLVSKVRKDLKFRDYNKIEENICTFIEYVFEKKQYPWFTWSDFVRNWYGKEGVTFTSYEKLKSETENELIKVVYELSGKKIMFEQAKKTVERYSFIKQSGREPGQEKTGRFLRKGIVGDWKNNLNRDAREMFNYYAGKELKMLKYEGNDDWVSNG